MLNAKLKNINECLIKSKVHKMNFLRAAASQKGLKGTNTRLKHQSEQFVREITYKGGRRPSAAAPLCRCLSQNSSNCCLSLVFFPFNPFWLAQALKYHIL